MTKNNLKSQIRRTYELHGCVKIKGALDEKFLTDLDRSIDSAYRDILNTSSDSNLTNYQEELPLVGFAFERWSEIAVSVMRNKTITNLLEEISGSDWQYVMSYFQHVYDGTFGSHRDTFFDIDLPKVLVCLSDQIPKEEESKISGSFAMLAGSHIPGKFSVLSDQLIAWPSWADSFQSDLPLEYEINGKELKGVSTDPYSAFLKIPFSRGDIIIFSQNSIHPVLPTNCSGYAPRLFQLSTVIGKSLLNTTEKNSKTELSTERLQRLIPNSIRMNTVTLGCGATFEERMTRLQQLNTKLKEMITQSLPNDIHEHFGACLSHYESQSIHPQSDDIFRDTTIKRRQELSKLISDSSAFKKQMNDSKSFSYKKVKSILGRFKRLIFQ
jgi:hypothetical protein